MLAYNNFLFSYHQQDMDKLSNFILPVSGQELYNTSVEEGIFPNVFNNNQSITVPSYQPEYDYNIEYNDAPLVYSWLPIAPGYKHDGFHNLHDFCHLDDQHESLNVSSSSAESEAISNQDVKYHDYLKKKHGDPELYKNHAFDGNSCNAMDLNISCNVQGTSTDPDLSFNDLSSKIVELQPIRKIVVPDVSKIMQDGGKPADELQANVSDELTKEERQRNESFELLKKEDSSKMIFFNERSPELFNTDGEDQTDSEAREEDDIIIEAMRPSDDCNGLIYKKLRNSLKGNCPPPPRHQLSLSELLEAYKKNVNVDSTQNSTIQTSSFFVPSHNPSEVVNMEWPQLASVKCLDVAYNRSENSEHIEVLCLQYGERFIGAETSTSSNLKNGPSSAKKRSERLK